MKYSLLEKNDMVQAYYEANASGRKAREIYARRFPSRNVPNFKTFIETVRKLREEGILHRKKKETIRNNEERILDLVSENPMVSTRTLANHPSVNKSKSTVWRVLKRNSYHPYHFRSCQTLEEGDFEKRKEFCEFILRRTRENRNFLRLILFTDEATFHRDGFFNNKNNIIWQRENPHATVAKNSQKRFSVNVWAGMKDGFIVGPYILPETLTGNGYNQFLRETLPDLLEDIPLSHFQGIWYQHDGCPAHTVRSVREFLDSQYPRRWIGRLGPVAWPPRSPDLTPMDFYFWGHMKSLVYDKRAPVTSREELIQRIESAAEEIRRNPEMVRSAVDSVAKRSRKCIRRNGNIFENEL